MPSRPEGVYLYGKGGWYVKVTLGTDPLTGQRGKITRRGFRTAAEVGRARRDLLAKVDGGQLKPSNAGMTVDELLDLHLDGLDADGRLSAKTRFDYRHYAGDYVRPHLGKKRVRDVTPEVVLVWQRKLIKQGGTKHGKLKLALGAGIVGVNPMVGTPRPRPKRSIPKHWSPEQVREFLALMEGDRTWPVWAFLLGSGLRIGELVALRWPNVDLESCPCRTTPVASLKRPSSYRQRSTRCCPFCSTHTEPLPNGPRTPISRPESGHGECLPSTRD